MQILPDTRRIRIYMLNTVDGKPTKDHAADAWQEVDGTLVVSGLWSGLIPFAHEDHMLMAKQIGVSSLEWLRRRLATCPVILAEVVE